MYIYQGHPGNDAGHAWNDAGHAWKTMVIHGIPWKTQILHHEMRYFFHVMRTFRSSLIQGSLDFHGKSLENHGNHSQGAWKVELSFF